MWALLQSSALESEVFGILSKPSTVSSSESELSLKLLFLILVLQVYLYRFLF